MSEPTIITCAVTGGGDTASRNPAVPVTPAEIAKSSIEAFDAGAAVLHIHVRDPATRRGSMEFELYAETVETIRRERPDAILNLTTGAGALLTTDQIRSGEGASLLATPAARAVHIQRLKPEICSLDLGSMNFGDRLFLNSAPDVMEIARLISETGTKPELEVFDIGQLRLLDQLLTKGLVKSPALIQICLGVPGGAPAETRMMALMASRLPKDATWTGFGIGAQQIPMATQSVILGGHVRVGLEDSLYIERGVLAPSNAALVQKAVAMLELLGRAPATPSEARAILGLSHG